MQPQPNLEQARHDAQAYARKHGLPVKACEQPPVAVLAPNWHAYEVFRESRFGVPSGQFAAHSELQIIAGILGITLSVDTLNRLRIMEITALRMQRG